MVQARKGTKKDIPGILSLQERNLYSNLTAQERKNGFVTTPFTVQQLEDIIQLNGLFVAADKENHIIAYLFAGDWAYFQQWDIFQLMVSRFPSLSFQDRKITTQNSFQYGPVCIDINYRGQGILQAIFEEMRLAFIEEFPISITFINQVNAVSTKAHTQKLGWKIIDRFEFNNNAYFGLAFDMTTSVVK